MPIITKTLSMVVANVCDIVNKHKKNYSRKSYLSCVRHSKTTSTILNLSE